MKLIVFFMLLLALPAQGQLFLDPSARCEQSFFSPVAQKRLELFFDLEHKDEYQIIPLGSAFNPQLGEDLWRVLERHFRKSLRMSHSKMERIYFTIDANHNNTLDFIDPSIMGQRLHQKFAQFLNPILHQLSPRMSKETGKQTLLGELRIIDKSAPDVGAWHIDGKHGRVIIPLMGPGTLITKEENITVQGLKTSLIHPHRQYALRLGQMLMTTGFDRNQSFPHKKATWHAVPRSHENRVILMIDW